MIRYLLVQKSTVLTFPDSKTRDSYNHVKLSAGDVWLSVNMQDKQYAVYNPFLFGTSVCRTVKFETFAEVLNYSEKF